MRALDGPSPPAFDHPSGRRRLRIPLGRPGRVRRKASQIVPRKAVEGVRMSGRRVASSVGWGLALAEGLALVTLYPVGSSGRTIILRAQVARPGMDRTNLLLGARPRERAVTGPIPDEAGPPEGAPAFGVGFRRASAQPPRERGRSRDSARARPPACAPWRRWRCAARAPSGRRCAQRTTGRAHSAADA